VHSPTLAEEPATLTLSVTDVPVAEAVRTLAAGASLALVIDPGAEAYAGCGRVSIETNGPRPVESVIGLARQSLAPYGFGLEHTDAGLVLSHAPGAPVPPTCADSGGEGEGRRPPVPESDVVAASDIRRIDGRTFTVSRRALERLVESNELARQVRIVPQMDNGAVTGLRVFGIRRDSVPARLGFANGDTIHSVNGHDISDPSAALEAYSRLRNAPRLEVRLTRAGEARVHTITIR
jgi:hypothetical protein